MTTVVMTPPAIPGVGGVDGTGLGTVEVIPSPMHGKHYKCTPVDHLLFVQNHYAMPSSSRRREFR